MSRIPRSILPLLLILAGASRGNPTDSAIERFQKLRDKIHQARNSKDWRANVEGAHELEQFLNESPQSLIESARAQVHANDLNGALGKAQKFAHMGQYTDLIETSAEFAPLRDAPGYSQIAKQMQENRTPVSLATTVFQLSDAALLAEDLDYDPAGKRFFITSVREKKIVTADEAGTLHDFAKAADDWPILAIKIDPARQVVWATEVAMQDFVFAPKKDWGRSAVLRFDLKTGKLLHRIEGPAGSALGDMTLTANGDVIVSDGEGGGIYRILAEGDHLERLDAGDFISPQTPAIHPDGKHVFVPDYVRGLALLNLASKQVLWLSTEGQFALDGIDGLYFDHGTLLAVQNGASPERVVGFPLNASLTGIASQTIFERATATLGDPTHGVVIGRDFYYIANSGWDVIDDHGNMKPEAKLTAPRIMRVPLEKY
jgi:hypothetical protein